MTILAQDFHGMSDDARQGEWAAQVLVARAKELLIEAARISDLCGEEIMDGLDALPNLQDWNEQIAEARRKF